MRTTTTTKKHHWSTPLYARAEQGKAGYALLWLLGVPLPLLLIVYLIRGH